VTLGASTAGLVAVATGLHEGEFVALREPGKSADELLPGAPAKPNRPR
jgi:hypothetical protein